VAISARRAANSPTRHRPGIFALLSVRNSRGGHPMAAPNARFYSPPVASGSAGRTRGIQRFPVKPRRNSSPPLNKLSGWAGLSGILFLLSKPITEP